MADALGTDIRTIRIKIGPSGAYLEVKENVDDKLYPVDLLVVAKRILELAILERP